MSLASLDDAWARVRAHAARLCDARIVDLFVAEPQRLAQFRRAAPASMGVGLTLDISKERIDAAALAALFDLAEAADLSGWRERLFAGEPVNATEGRAALHPALRGPGPFSALGRPVSEEVGAVRARMRAFAGEAADRFDAIVHLGIGGSDLGPRLVYEALRPLRREGVAVRFAANVDGADILDALEGLDPSRTLLVVASKTFTTVETLANAETARAWLAAGAGAHAVNGQLCAVTAAPARAQAWGVSADAIFPFWDWVGGRYSVWSAVGISVAAGLAEGVFDRLLAGAAAMDQHFLAAPWPENLPVLSALAHAWNRAGMMAPGVATLPYARRLQLLPAYLQQLEMESNGKGVDRAGRPLSAPAAGVTWGEPGANAQHSFMQALHQGALVIPAEFIVIAHGEGPPERQRVLNANALAQAEALLVGKDRGAVEAELRALGLSEAAVADLAPHKTFPGDRPSTIIGLEKLTPESLGALLAFYEHRTFAQGVLHGVNSFDQWGVELGKALAAPIAGELAGAAPAAHDPSTAAWIAALRD